MFDGRPFGRRWTGLADGLAWTYLVPGGVLVLLGLLILLVPHLLEALVATALMVAGGSLLLFGWRLRQPVRRRTDARDVWPY